MLKLESRSLERIYKRLDKIKQCDDKISGRDRSTPSFMEAEG